MKVKCLNCGLVLEKCLSLDCVCPRCDTSRWCVIFEGSEDTMMGLTMKARDKCDRENLERLKKFLEETYFLAKYWLEKNGYMYSEKMGVPHDYLEILKDLLQQMNKNYRDLIEEHLLADLPIDPIDLSKLYQAQLEMIMNIKI